ncbi:hypothetical protein EVAR_47106_1 [Eumeta japonica]|uniref:Uncharacterized protein n=1 Tax=Eumeta variegata TaxID=151549 RepID=A0A4C1Y9D1_EUMVA|nr:hypothetical protein EVAR_47106_1 [Eumeta japonica]
MRLKRLIQKLSSIRHFTGKIQNLLVDTGSTPRNTHKKIYDNDGPARGRMEKKKHEEQIESEERVPAPDRPHKSETTLGRCNFCSAGPEPSRFANCRVCKATAAGAGFDGFLATIRTNRPL